MPDLKSQENEEADIPLSVLYMWQQALQVPIEQLLVEPLYDLSDPVRQRASLLRLAKTALALHARTTEEPLRRLSQLVVDQLTELMPELKDVVPWPERGVLRSLDDLGKTAQRPISDTWVFGEDRPDD